MRAMRLYLAKVSFSQYRVVFVYDAKLYAGGTAVKGCGVNTANGMSRRMRAAGKKACLRCTVAGLNNLARGATGL